MSDLRAALQETWSKALTAANSAEEQAQALMGRVGGLLDHANPTELLQEVTGRLQAQRQELNGHVQEAVKSALEKLRLTSIAELAAVRGRLAALEARLAAAEADKAGSGDRHDA